MVSILQGHHRQTERIRPSTTNHGYPAAKKDVFILPRRRAVYAKRIAPHPKKYEAVRSNYIINILETYEEIKESFHYLTRQIGNPDMVRF
jgi:hypothetical protein